MSIEATIHRIDHPLCRLGEGPNWNPRQGKLYWTDIDGRTLWQYDPASDQARLFREGDMKVGGFGFESDDRLVIFTDTGVFSLAADGRGEPQPLFDVSLAEKERFNDVIIDPVGRGIGGTLRGGTREGKLYSFEKGKDPVVLLEGLGCSNGMAFTEDGRTFYHTDSADRQIKRYDYDVATGQLSNGELFYQHDESLGVPDGCTMDAEGQIWVACWGGKCVLRLGKDGQVEQKVEMPALQCTSCMFGGEDLSTLYVTTAAGGAEDLETGLDSEGRFRGGTTYALRPGVRGRREHDAKLI
ncbi:MAG: SMP-30/gluconolactonase/LRE family protein [Phycisphaeraceae bacterium]